jgi:hypothetical protein
MLTIAACRPCASCLPELVNFFKAFASTLTKGIERQIKARASSQIRNVD